VRYLRKNDSNPGVDISPLIDMVFILLIFFMVSTTFVKDMKVDVERPSAASAVRASTKSVRVHIERTGSIYIDGQPVKSWMLQSRVRDLIKSGASASILVIADRLVPAEKLVEVVDQCRLGGAKDVGVATEKEAG
jgi:biopolymer transport protein ExbD